MNTEALAHTAGIEAARLSAALESIGFTGWDPYDGLSAPAVRFAARTRLPRQAAIQFFKRMPVNLRPIVGIRARRHAKALALCVSAYARLAELPDGQRYAALAVALADDLADRAVVQDGAPVGWGYDFDVQTRWGFYPAGKPNAVVTAFALMALSDAAALPGANPRLPALAEQVAKSVPETFLVTTPDGAFFGYYQGARIPIYNASTILANAAAHSARRSPDVVRAAAAAIEYTIERQAPDGSWPYGDGPRLGWVDGYHTAYILVALDQWREVAGDPPGDFALDRGLRLYVDRLFEPSGAPRATIRRRYPIDIHAASSAIWALTMLRHRLDEAMPLAGRVLFWTQTHMRRNDGRYAYQLHAHHRHSVPFVRWNDGHMLLALATVAAEGRVDGG